MLEKIIIDKLVFGGQGLATLADGRKVFVWNALPGEEAEVRITKSKRSYVEAIAENILKSSPERQDAREINYLATSPWQIMNFAYENQIKKEIMSELLFQAHIELSVFDLTYENQEWLYRNKMEYSFWGDDEGLHLALHRRGSHVKDIVKGSQLALPSIDQAAKAILEVLTKLSPRAGDLKTLIIRSNQAGETVASLYVKLEKFKKIVLPQGLKGIRVYYSNPKSPASVPTKLLQEIGNPLLEESLLGKPFSYDVDSFFQVNVPMFEVALSRMRSYGGSSKVTDMYAGVGSIGLSIAEDEVDLVELDPSTVAMARYNASFSKLKANVFETSAEAALDYITAERPIVLDPPRAGLHARVVERLLAVCPPVIVYLSCNPATQVRDLSKLLEQYKIKHFEVFNFFPKTPHIESLAILVPKG